jgi:hypothetical protein
MGKHEGRGRFERIGARSGGLGVKAARRRLPLLAVVVVVLCGCGASGGDPLHQVVGAARKTAALTWVRYQVALARSQLFPRGVTVQGGRAAYDFHTRLGYEFLVLRTSDGGSETLWLDIAPATLLLSPQPAPAGALPAGKLWISLPLSGRGASGRFAAQAQGLVPELPLDELAWGARAASYVGSRVVGQVPMDEYKVSVDLTKALAAARRAGRAAVVSGLDSERRAAGSGRLTIHVWIDGPGYVGRIDAPVPGSGLGTTSLVFTSFTRRYTGTAPPPSQIVPLASLPRAGRSLWAVATGS